MEEIGAHVPKTLRCALIRTVAMGVARRVKIMFILREGEPVARL